MTSVTQMKLDAFRRVFIIGAGASADAGMALGNVLLQKVVDTAENEQTTEQEFLNIVSNIKERLRIIFPTAIENGKYPNFEDYLNLVYDFAKGSNIGQAELNGKLEALSCGIDKEVMVLLYWYLYTACRRWAGRMSIDYLPDFISTEVNLETDAVISLNYDWLFERVLIKTLHGQINPETIRLGFGTNICDIASGNIDSIYGSHSKYAFYKPHGSANWIIGKKGLMHRDESAGEISFVGDSTLKILCEKEKSEIIVYFCNKYLDYKEILAKNLITAIVPPIGIKGYLGPTMICEILGIKNPDNVQEYSVFEELISGQVEGTVKAIHSLNENGEIWLIGTKLFIDPYLYNQVRLKKINTPSIKIIFVSPDEEAAKVLANDLGQIFHFKGTLKDYSILLGIKNGMKAGRWKGLNLDIDFEKKSKFGGLK